MNQKGFAISGMLYAILILFLMLVLSILAMLGNRKAILDKLKVDVLNGIESSVVQGDQSGAAAPELTGNLIPIKWDEVKLQWVKADSSNPTGTYQWYDYSSKMWANAVTVTASTRSGYQAALPGTEIKEEDVLTYLVWIPRYKYKLFNVSTASTNPQTIDVVFESKHIAKETGTTNGSYLTHPAFTFGDMELNGIWVGKFETTGSISTPCSSADCDTATLTIKPNLASIRSQTTSSMFYAVRSMQRENNMYGFSSNGMDTHMMKNMEWGAVAYLSNSKYGKNSEVWVNNHKQFVTGCIGSSVTEPAYDGCQNTYSSATGVNGSTTGNIYGIYDMAGGSFERVMGVVYTSDNQTLSLSASGFDQATLDSPDMEKYVNKYAYGTTDQDVAAYRRRLLGDATGETFGWNSDTAYFASDVSPWFDRGGSYGETTGVGVFNFTRWKGGSYSNTSFRIVVSVS